MSGRYDDECRAFIQEHGECLYSVGRQGCRECGIGLVAVHIARGDDIGTLVAYIPHVELSRLPLSSAIRKSVRHKVESYNPQSEVVVFIHTPDDEVYLTDITNRWEPQATANDHAAHQADRKETR